MTDISIAEADLADLIARVEAGEDVRLTRGGEPVVRLVSIRRSAPAEREPIDLAALRTLTEGMTPQTVSAGDFVRWMRDTDRY